MKSKNLTGYLINVLDDLSGSITISNTLDSLYAILNCDLIDITYLTLGKKGFCVIADDEGPVPKHLFAQIGWMPEGFV